MTQRGKVGFRRGDQAYAIEELIAELGDLNTGNQLVDKSAGGARYFCAEGFDALTSEASLVDLWRRTNGMDAHEWTWLSNQNGFRIDHAFGNQPFVHLVQPSCIYDHRPREEHITDHSALLITGITTKIAGLVPV
jgi:hypothetical protein